MSNNQSSVKCTKMLLLLFVLIMVLGGLYFLYLNRQAKEETVVAENNIKIDGTYLEKPTVLKSFQLTDNHDKTFTNKNLQGKWTFMFFGFTNCGYVCPITLTELNKMYKIIQKTSDKKSMPQVVFVSVDPDRDSVKKVNTFVNKFNAAFIGLRGNQDQTNNIVNQLHITATKVYEEGAPKDDYMINHSAEIFVFNPKGELKAYFAYPHKAEQMVKDYNVLLENNAG